MKSFSYYTLAQPVSPLILGCEQQSGWRAWKAGGVAAKIERLRNQRSEERWQSQGESGAGGRQGNERLPPCLCVKGSVPKDGDS